MRAGYADLSQIQSLGDDRSLRSLASSFSIITEQCVDAFGGTRPCVVVDCFASATFPYDRFETRRFSRLLEDLSSQSGSGEEQCLQLVHLNISDESMAFRSSLGIRSYGGMDRRLDKFCALLRSGSLG